MRYLTFAIGCAAALSFSPLARAADTKKHAVLIVWDGMRPDFVREDLTPNLCALATRGVTFANHHSVYMTMTEVNGAAIATGAAPEVNGIIANSEFRPGVDPTQPRDMFDPAFIADQERVTGAPFLGLATLPELARKAGMRTAVAGTKPVALLFDRTTDPAARGENVLLSQGVTLPEAAAADLAKRVGKKFPATSSSPITKRDHDLWTTRALCEGMWQSGVPEVSVLWLAEPDYSQHNYGPGAPTALAAIRNSDDCLAMVVRSLEAKGALETTDIIVVSDHGFSTVERSAGCGEWLKKAGFDVVAKAGPAGAVGAGQIMLVSNNGSVSFYVGGTDPAVIARLAQSLQASPFAGVVLTRDGLPGTFPFKDACIDTKNAPDVIVSMRWSEGKGALETPGLLTSSGYGPGQGDHASLSRFETHNMCIAAGPDFKRGMVSALPTGNADITPTICAIMGIAPDPKQTGRALGEALKYFEPPAGHPKTTTLRASAPGWEQTLTVTEFEGRRYIDEGNGGPVK